MDYVYEYLKKKLGRVPTAEEYVAQNGVDEADIESEMVAMSPEELREDIQRLADDARTEKRNRPYRAHHKPRTDFMM